MKLNIFERFGLLDILPREGGYADMVTLRRAREILSLTADEMKVLDYQEQDNGERKTIFFDSKKAIDMEKELPIDEWTTKTIQNILSKMEKEKKLPEKYLTLFEKFVITYA